VCLGKVGILIVYKAYTNWQKLLSDKIMRLYRVIQGGKVNVLRGNTVGLCEITRSYEHVFNSE
jgi:hypothetical protein